MKRGLLADLFDIQDICLAYVAALDALSNGTPTEREFDGFLDFLDIELLEHLPFHIRSLRKGVPKARRDLESRGKHQPGA